MQASSGFQEYLLGDQQARNPANIALFEAVATGERRDVREVLKRHPTASPNWFNAEEDSKNAFMLACERGFFDLIDLLLDAPVPACIEAKQLSSGNTPIFFAVIYNPISDTILNKLIERGADVRAKNIYGNTPLHEAAKVASISKIQRLIDCGADVEARNNKGSTPLLFSLYAFDSPVEIVIPTVQCLLHNGASIVAADDEGMTPLHVAASRGEVQLIEELLNKGAQINAKTSRGETPLDVARFHNHRQAIDFLTARANA
jgi:ankyrin repeat protein